MLLYPTLANVMSEFWWTFVARGIAALLFGIGVLLFPGATLVFFLGIFAAYCIVEGCFSLIAGGKPHGSFRSLAQHEPRWGSPLLSGVLSIVVGAIALAWPVSALIAIDFLLGLWLIMRGFLELSAAVELRRTLFVGQGTLLGLVGLISAATGLVAIAWPVIGAISVTYLLGVYALVYGTMLILVGSRLRSIRSKILEEADEYWRRNEAA